MADLFVKFTCTCGAEKEAAFIEEGPNDSDIVHCACGRKYVITKPFIGDILGMAEYVTSPEGED